MAEICCDLIQRTVRKRRMEIRRIEFAAGVHDRPVQPLEDCRKRQRMEFAEPQKDFTGGREDRVDENAGEEAFCRNSDAEKPQAAARFQKSPSIWDLCPTYGVMSVCGRRRDMEDAVSVHPDLRRRNGRNPAWRHHFFGVFDGHGCSHLLRIDPQVAVSCKERMHDLVAAELNQLGADPSTNEEWKSLMEKCFSLMDSEAAAWRGGPGILSCRCEFQLPMCDHVGSTAAVAVVSVDHIIVANCGDSRVVLCRDSVPVPLSSDHKPDRPDELRRVLDAGGHVIYWDGARVLGVLGMSRAIGEIYALRCGFCVYFFMVCLPPFYPAAGDGYLKPFVISEPEVTVTERAEEDKCLILATDGLWDVVTNEMACEVVTMCLRSSRSRRGSDKACSDAALLLTKLALARRSADNVSVVVVDLRRKLCG
ncbi:Protein phosphatase 2C 3 [Apostasia shenzhenica]|uniref:protein-serine/threonine phosphatase n=1 Tax=Apostasia shenzhenica TaxID=1088818 RepID=A0A2I0B850_9ASPA|nr:Protein phosphatase 2C 3 [Apostasia shenzhenica]